MCTERRIAFATCGALPELSSSDALVLAPLAERGWRVDAHAWDAPAVDWQRYAAVVVRSTWDYHLRLPDFLEWMETLEQQGVALWNPPSRVRWNADKIYLLALEQAGLGVVPTLWLERGPAPDLAQLMRERSWERVVLKPRVSASAHGAYDIQAHRVAAGQRTMERLLDAGGVMLQPFVAEIESEGELSLIFFGRRFSHAVRKRPRRGEFRVQSEFGGAVESLVASQSWVEAAARILESVPGPLLYARVDMVPRREGLLLMELELIEPALFLHTDEGAPQRFADAILACL